MTDGINAKVRTHLLGDPEQLRRVSSLRVFVECRFVYALFNQGKCVTKRTMDSDSCFMLGHTCNNNLDGQEKAPFCNVECFFGSNIFSLDDNSIVIADLRLQKTVTNHDRTDTRRHRFHREFHNTAAEH